MAPQIRSAVSFLFHAGIVALIVTSFKPLPVKAHPILLKSLLNGTDAGYIVPGSEFQSFKAFLPKRGKISFITEHDTGVNQDEEKMMYDAQNYLVPLLLTPDPTEDIAILICPNHETAQDRLNLLGYRWVRELFDGKGVAEKIK